MKIKVCGLRDAANLEQVAALNPDFVGFIFYDHRPGLWVTIGCSRC
jgi:phosphoribosylanthranilate isomerase